MAAKKARTTRPRRKQTWIEQAAREMKPNRVSARFFSGGKHQTWKAIVTSPARSRRKTITPKQGRKLYQKQMSREKRARTRAEAAARKQRTADQRASRAQARGQQPKPKPARRAPIAVNPHTGRPLTWAEAQSGARDANWQAARIEAELEGREVPARPGRRKTPPASEPAPLTPLQAAIEEAKKTPAARARAAAKKKSQQEAARKKRERERAAARRQKEKDKREARRQREARTRAARREREVQRHRERRTAGDAKARSSAGRTRTTSAGTVTGRLAASVERLLADGATLAPPANTRTNPAAGQVAPVSRTKATRTARRKGVYGVVMARKCPCGGTGRIPLYDDQQRPAGSASCPRHGRAGSKRGAKRWTTKGAIRDSGLPGLAAWLAKRHERTRGNSDERQITARTRALEQLRYAGPSIECKAKFCEQGVTERRITLLARQQHMERARQKAQAAIAAAIAHNARVDQDGEGKKVKVPRRPSKKQLEAAARREFPHRLCKVCGGLGVVPNSRSLLSDGTQPVPEWRAATRLKEGHRPTARERTTGRKKTDNAVRVQNKRRLPPL